MKKRRNRVIALIICVIMLGSLNLQYAQAATEDNRKEEVVYANLDGNGVLKDTYVVNIWKEKSITDYGNYSQVKNLNTKDELHNSNGVITINNSKDCLYYEGILKDSELPWYIKIQYLMDGVSYTADEIAGRSGNLTIEIDITENPRAKKGFFENYALQVLVKLDSKKCSNIATEGATLANVGILKQLTYTIMSGREKTIRITSDVTDFEMESIQLNGIRLNLGIDSSLIDTGSINGKLGDINTAVTDIDDGANELKEGAAALKDGAVKLQDGIIVVQGNLNKLNTNSKNLTNGSGRVKEALSIIQSSLQNIDMTVKNLDQLGTASVQINEGINSLVGGLYTIQDTINTYHTKLSDAGLSNTELFLGKHKEAITALGITATQRELYNAYLSGGESGVQKKLAELIAGGDKEAVQLYKKAAGGEQQAIIDYITTAGKLISMETLLNADISYIQGSNQIISGIDNALDQDKGPLMVGALSLQSNYNTFNTAIQSMVSSLGSIATDMARLKSGIDILTEDYNTFDRGLRTYTKAVNNITVGYEQICKGALQMTTGTSDLYDGTKAMTDGTQKFVNETSHIDDNIDSGINQLLNEYSGSDYQTVSFVSEKNTRIKAVQFVIKTTAVKKKEAVTTVAAKEKPLNLWQKFLRLFGLY